MSEIKKRIEDLAHVRSLMEESTRFVSLSGLSGVGVGVTALIGAAIGYQYLNQMAWWTMRNSYEPVSLTEKEWYTLVGIALSILAAAILVAAFFTIRNTRKQGKNIWTRAGQRMVINLMVPLAAGGIFCLQLKMAGELIMIAPATLLFYGLALVNAGKYTLREVRLLGLSEIALGLLAGFWPGNGLLFWVVGFGVLHIAYGLYMYVRYER